MVAPLGRLGAGGRWLLGLLLLFSVAAGAGEVLPWPGAAGREVGRRGAAGGLPVGVEPSGLIWHPGLGVLVVVGDGGSVSRLDGTGTGTGTGDGVGNGDGEHGLWTTWHPGGDLEGIALVDPTTSVILLGSEDPDAVVEFDLARGVLTGNEWDLSSIMTGDENRGLEALTAGAGLVFAGHQGSGQIYVFSLLSEGEVELQSVLSPLPERTDLSGLHFDRATGSIFALHDADNVIRQMSLDGTVLQEFALPGDEQEGLTVVPDCARGQAVIFVAQDSGQVWRYPGFPLTCSPARPNPAGLPVGSDSGNVHQQGAPVKDQ